ncbi:MAG: LysR family transcriptional regulator [Devosia sp.]|uniref:LysR family transcriptional regulator n=1 Tax=Devosia sp. TaxID=1871048 RepID=UPI001ACE3DFF|nr:LysR family transcriptional regulator [Devosia sp.]MBN9315350.1 LysR family transcriptional regulator [Devosia sp.]
MHNWGMFEWGDLRYLLAVARHGSTLAAARALGVNQSTVHRRLAELERRLGTPLAVRRPTGYQLTEFGSVILPLARSVEDAVIALERQARGAGEAVTGTIRLTCPEPIVGRLTQSGLLDRFHARYPDAHVELLTSDRYLDLSRGEADVALRSGEPEDPHLVGRKVADSFWALYASPEYIARHGAPAGTADLRRHRLVAFDGAMSQHRANVWLASVAPGATIAATNSSVLGVLLAARSGVGLAALPTTIAEGEPGLVEVLPTIPELTRGWYLLTHPDLRRQPRIAAFFAFVFADLAALRAVLMG